MEVYKLSIIENNSAVLKSMTFYSEKEARVVLENMCQEERINGRKKLNRPINNGGLIGILKTGIYLYDIPFCKIRTQSLLRLCTLLTSANNENKKYILTKLN